MSNQDQRLLRDVANNCMCGHLVCTFPNCDNGEPEHPVFDNGCPLCRQLGEPCLKHLNDNICHCGLVIGTCDKCFNGDAIPSPRIGE